ncbi:MAG: hypothetical protein ACTJLM_03995 [Ehrlichia sp.]
MLSEEEPSSSRSGSQVSLLSSEEDDGEVRGIAPQTRWKSALNIKLRSVDFDKLFLQISFIILVVEAVSGTFNLVTTYATVPSRVKDISAIIFYTLHTILTLCMIVSSILAIKKAVNSKKAIPQSKKEISSAESKLLIRQNNVKISENSFTLISHMLWVTVCLSALTMQLTTGNPILEQACLFLSIIVPVLCITSCILRVLDATMENKKSSSDKRKHTQNLMSLYASLILFEAVHCACHIVEALALNGSLQNIYNFQNRIVLYLEVLTTLTFIVAFFIESYLQSKADAQAPTSSLDNLECSGEKRPLITK